MTTTSASLTGWPTRTSRTSAVQPSRWKASPTIAARPAVPPRFDPKTTRTFMSLTASAPSDTSVVAVSEGAVRTEFPVDFRITGFPAADPIGASPVTPDPVTSDAAAPHPLADAPFDDQAEQPPKDACGVFGVWAPGEDVAKLTYFGLYALQHRGQEAAGMAVSDGTTVVVYKELGLVAQVFDEATLSALGGHLAIGHCRYSTTGSGTWENAQPSYRPASHGGGIALGHNGNLTNTAVLSSKAVKPVDPRRPQPKATNDSDLITALLAANPDLSLEAAALEVLPLLQGAFSLVFMDEHTLYAARDPHGVRPLVLGRLERGWVVASETAALDIVGASFVREIEPGELVSIDEHGLRTQRFADATPKGCLFEYVYLARPDTSIAGRSVHETRVEVGRRLAREAPVDADL